MFILEITIHCLLPHPLPGLDLRVAIDIKTAKRIYINNTCNNKVNLIRFIIANIVILLSNLLTISIKLMKSVKFL